MNRGVHAVVWSVLLREVCTYLSCYELIGGIDEGILIDAYGVDIEKNDNTIAVNEKLARGLPYLLNAVVEYFSGEKEGVFNIEEQSEESRKEDREGAAF